MKIDKILLLDPPFFRFFNERQSSPPLGLAYLASSLRKSGFNDVVIYNADFADSAALKECGKDFFEEVSNYELYKRRAENIDDPLYKEVLSTIAEYSPDLIGISLKTAKFFISKNIIRLVKKNLPGTIIVAGGAHASVEPAHVLLGTEADFVIRGEAELSFPELLKRLKDDEGSLSSLGGLSFRDRGKVTHNKRFELIKELDSLAFPDKDSLLYGDRLARDDFGNIFSSRGCPFSCSFCDSPSIWTNKVRKRSAANIVDEMSLVKEKYGTAFFGFYDDCFVTKREYTLEFCQEVKKRGLNKLHRSEFRWWCEVHPSCISEEIAQNIKEAGCVAVALGAESGSQKVLDASHKSSSLELIRRACAIIKAAGLDLSLFFMIGFPSETEEDIYRTVRFMKELNPDSGNLSILTPHPGTAIYRECTDLGLIDYDQDFINCFHQRSSHFYSPFISDERSRIIIYDAFKQVDEFIQENRKNKIYAILKNKIFSNLCQKHRIEINLESQLACRPDYAQKKIYINLKNVSRADFVSQEFKDDLTERLLRELPQYSQVSINAA